MEKGAKKATVYPIPEMPVNMLGRLSVDPLGSYTGIPEDPLEKPVQDADDL